MSHPTEEELEQVVAGKLSEEREGEIEAHLHGCPICLQRFESVQRAAAKQLKELVGQAAVGSTPHAENSSVRSTNEQKRRELEDTSTQQSPDLPKIAGYEIFEILGRGGMGVVYKAKQKSLDRMVALKLITSEYGGSGERNRLRREAKAMARLEHPNVVKIHAIEDTGDYLFLCLEYIDGGSLHDWLLNHSVVAREAAGFVNVLADAVHYAHGKGIVHRDLKPGNILLHGGILNPKITDFGLVKHLPNQITLTRPGQIIGTPSYMAPEQALGDVHRIDFRVDIYALGAVLYEMLTGQPPFKGRTVVETLRQVVEYDAVSPRVLKPGTPESLERICLKCLEKKPENRFSTAKELADTLAEYESPIGSKLCVADGPSTVSDLYREVPATLRENLCVGVEGYIDTWTRGFVGREFVTEGLDRFLEDSQNPSGYFLIVGEPGIGKSALMAHLVKTRRYIHHFNSLENDPRLFVRNVCSQIIGRCKLPYTQLPKEAYDTPPKFLTRILEEASRKLTEGEQLVLALDALDEAKDVEVGDPNIHFLPKALNRGVFVVVTTRPGARSRLRVGYSRAFDFQETEHLQSNKNDAELYIRDWLRDAGVQEWMKTDRYTDDEFVSKLLEKSQANFMYLHHVLPAIGKANSKLRNARTFRLHELPDGLLAFYEQHWEQMQREDRDLFERLYEPVVCVLAAAERPVTIDVVADVTGLRRRDVSRVLSEWREFLYPEMGQSGLELYRVYHRSFQEFLEREVDGLRRYYDMIGDFAMAELGIE